MKHLLMIAICLGLAAQQPQVFPPNSWPPHPTRIVNLTGVFTNLTPTVDIYTTGPHEYLIVTGIDSTNLEFPQFEQNFGGNRVPVSAPIGWVLSPSTALQAEIGDDLSGVGTYALSGYVVKR